MHEGLLFFMHYETEIAYLVLLAVQGIEVASAAVAIIECYICYDIT